MSTNANADRDQPASQLDGGGTGSRSNSVATDRGDHRDNAADERHYSGPADAVWRDTTTTNNGRAGAVAAPGRHDVLHREQEHYGGVKVGSAFFGWLTATGTAVLLTALVAAAGTAVGLSTGTDVTDAASSAASDPSTIGIVGGIVLLVVLFVAYYCGGYVAGRMARFNGAKQGVAVWLWALVIAALVAVLGAVAGTKFNVLANLNSFPRIPIGEGDLSTAGIVAAVGVAVTSLVGAVLGGLAGMRFHRKVDRAGFGDE